MLAMVIHILASRQLVGQKTAGGLRAKKRASPPPGSVSRGSECDDMIRYDSAVKSTLQSAVTMGNPVLITFDRPVHFCSSHPLLSLQDG